MSSTRASDTSKEPGRLHDSQHTRADAERYVRELYGSLLLREPGEEELRHWTDLVFGGMPDRDVFSRFLSSEEYRLKHQVVPGHPIGHYYSPIVDPNATPVPRRDISPDEILGIDLSVSRMTDWWIRNRKVIQGTAFPEDEDPTKRYYSRNNIYPYGDAVLLRAMMIAHRPRRIIEVGSGFSSACMLDTVDEVGLDTELTFIEPDTERLLSRLREGDADRVRIITSNVQTVPTQEFEALRGGDILFIDSSHVLKTGSDVHYELFEILPILAKDVLVHFHDIGYPFEYLDDWIFERGYSWNEAYAVRAFLMYNQTFRVEFMSSLFTRMAREIIDATLPPFGQQPNGSLWIRKIRRPTRTKVRGKS